MFKCLYEHDVLYFWDRGSINICWQKIDSADVLEEYVGVLGNLGNKRAQRHETRSLVVCEPTPLWKPRAAEKTLLFDGVLYFFRDYMRQMMTNVSRKKINDILALLISNINVLTNVLHI